jgi:hypothetical protein
MSKLESSPENAQLASSGGRAALAASRTVARWLLALEARQDIGHFGRLAFVSIARHFLSSDELVALLARQPRWDQAKAQKLVERVRQRGYSPPTRPRLLEWQARQRYPLLDDPADPTLGNLYRELPLPDEVFREIEAFWDGSGEAAAG